MKKASYFIIICNQVSNTEENLAAVVRLLSLVIKKVPREILVSRYGTLLLPFSENSVI